MNKPVDIIKYRGKKIKIYADDYGQCYYFIYKKRSYSCGSYNTDYLYEITSVIDDDLDEVFYVQPIKPHHPSAKVYKRYGIWYCNYNGDYGFFVSYGDLLKKKDRPTLKDLTAEVQKIMESSDRVNDPK